MRDNLSSLGHVKERMKMPTIYIDADACPVKAEAEEIASRHQLRLVIVSSRGRRPSANPLVELVIVSEGADMAVKARPPCHV